LKLSLLRNGLRQSGGRRAAYIASAVCALLFAVLQFAGLVALRGVGHVESLVVLLVAVLGLGWAVMPLFFPSGDEPLDPTRLVMLPLRPEPLGRSLRVASLVGIGPQFTRCLLAGSGIAVAAGRAAFAVAVLAVRLALLLGVALAPAAAARTAGAGPAAGVAGGRRPAVHAVPAGRFGARRGGRRGCLGGRGPRRPAGAAGVRGAGAGGRRGQRTAAEQPPRSGPGGAQ